jgi:hypothetical protein
VLRGEEDVGVERRHARARRGDRRTWSFQIKAHGHKDPGHPAGVAEAQRVSRGGRRRRELGVKGDERRWAWTGLRTGAHSDVLCWFFGDYFYEGEGGDRGASARAGSGLHRSEYCVSREPCMFVLCAAADACALYGAIAAAAFFCCLLLCLCSRLLAFS